NLFYHHRAAALTSSLTLHDALPISDIRLTKIGHDIGLIDDDRYKKLLVKEKRIQDEIERVGKVHIGAGKEVQDFPAPICTFPTRDRKGTRLNFSHVSIQYAVSCLNK